MIEIKYRRVRKRHVKIKFFSVFYIFISVLSILLDDPGVVSRSC